MQTKLSKTKAFLSFFVMSMLMFTSLPSQSQATLKCNSIEECKKLFEESAKSFLGTSYSYGNMGKGGFDCSGLVLTMANQLMNQVTLPRRSQDMYSMLTESITLQNAKMGDLIFFNTGRGVSHVGLYWGKDDKNRNIMYHASSSKGVEIRVLDGNKYWMSRLVGIKRFAPLTNAVSVLGNEQKNENKKEEQKKEIVKAKEEKTSKRGKVSKKILRIFKSKKKTNKAQDEKPQKEETKVSITPTSSKFTEKTPEVQTAKLDINSNVTSNLRAPDEKPQGFYITADYKEEIELNDKYQYPIPQENYEYDYEISYEYEVVYN